MPTSLIVLAAFLWAMAQPDETIYRYGAAGRDWQLAEQRSPPFDGDAGLTCPDRNGIAGHGPCNRFTSRNILPYPWFEADPIAATRSTCPALDLERAFFEALEAADLAIIENGVLTLSTEAGETLLVFRAGG